METLKKNKLYAKYSKYEFWIHEVQVLGHVVTKVGIKVDPTKFDVVMKLESPKNPFKI